MPHTGDFDPAEAIRRQRAAEEAERQREESEARRIQATRERNRADRLKTLRYAEGQLGDVRDPVVSEFVVTERWQLREGFFRVRFRGFQREIRYYGSWLALGSTVRGAGGSVSERRGLVKLREPDVGYAWVTAGGSDPRNTAHFETHLGVLESSPRPARYEETRDTGFRIVASLEEAADSVEKLPSPEQRDMASIEILTKAVGHALSFVETGQPPRPEVIPFDY